MIHLSERLQHGGTLSQAWSNNNWEMQWCLAHHYDSSLEGSGSKGKGKGIAQDMMMLIPIEAGNHVLTLLVQNTQSC